MLFEVGLATVDSQAHFPCLNFLKKKVNAGADSAGSQGGMPVCLHVFMVQSTLGTVLVAYCAFAPPRYVIVVEATVA